ncbi:MAG: LolA family protein [Methyloligellaceae bacterium]
MNKNKILRICSLCFLGGVMTLAVSGAGIADNAAKKPSGNPVGGGTGWNAEVTKGDKTPGPKDMDDETKAFVQSVSDYFNAISFMEGGFIQTNPDNQKAKGHFYVKRPGKLRFDYSPPSKLRIVADGRWLSIEDHDLKTFDRYPLGSTPFKLLLAEKVDLLKDAKIVDISRGETVAIISVSDKEDDSSGQLKLFFSIPELQLVQWIITDPQGLDTSIEISEMVLDKKKNDKFFDVADETANIITD